MRRMLYYAVLYFTAYYHTDWYCTMLFYPMLVYTILSFNTVMFCTLLYYPVLSFTVLYCTIHARFASHKNPSIGAAQTLCALLALGPGLKQPSARPQVLHARDVRSAPDLNCAHGAHARTRPRAHAPTRALCVALVLLWGRR